MGATSLRPERGRVLAIPYGALRTKTDRPKRKAYGQARASGGRATRQVRVSDLPDTFIKRPGGKLLVIQRAGRGAGTEAEWIEGKRESRVVGLLLRTATRKKRLEFFGAWEALQRERDTRYSRELDRVLTSLR